MFPNHLQVGYQRASFYVFIFKYKIIIVKFETSDLVIILLTHVDRFILMEDLVR